MSKLYDFNEDKNEWLKLTRKIGFEDVIQAVETGGLLDDIPHHNLKRYPNQRILVVKMGKYVYECPYVVKGEGIFMKTIYPSRKLTKHYLGKK